ncbi:NAD(P)H-dependent glycerol-3-phosphate dehydrogenase [Pararhodobacter sp.]|uniref:NAD(P)H-dependent glycerol-3-phosphate dehydrogenase n=1 Tax=Pararhodobacter sp. TaxID=2127056 RepID=UPI002FDDB905
MAEAERIGVIGAGAFGTALAIAQATAGRAVTLWARNPDQAAEMDRLRENRARLPGVPLPGALRVTSDFDEAAAAPVLLLALPTQTLRSVLGAHGAALSGRMLVACSKGVELGTGLLPAQIMAEMVPDARTAVLTGPSFAIDIAQGKPTALTLATTAPRAQALQNSLSTRNLRLYLSDDPLGAQLGGALKNVVAIAAGITMGAGLGESARAALMTRGFAEIARFAESRKAQAATLWGLSGFGDLVLTCTSEKSRNFRHGLAVGAGQAPDTSQTVEGVMTAHAMAAGADQDALPVTCMVSALLNGQVALPDAIDLLLTRPLKRETD